MFAKKTPACIADIFPDEFTTVTVCEGDQLQIRCSKTTRIAVLSAMFGRTAAGDKKCPELLRNTSSLQTSKTRKRKFKNLSFEPE